MSRDRRFYILATIALLGIEILIALFVRDRIIRPYGGDVLAVMLVYAGLRAATRLGERAAVGFALLIALAIEIGQYFHAVERIGLGGSRVARVVLGTGFDWADLLSYALGGAAVVAIEAGRRACARRRAAE